MSLYALWNGDMTAGWSQIPEKYEIRFCDDSVGFPGEGQIKDGYQFLAWLRDVVDLIMNSIDNSVHSSAL